MRSHSILVTRIRVGDTIMGRGVVTDILDGGAQLRFTLDTGRDVYFTKDVALRVIRKV